MLSFLTLGIDLTLSNGEGLLTPSPEKGLGMRS